MENYVEEVEPVVGDGGDAGNGGNTSTSVKQFCWAISSD